MLTDYGCKRTTPSTTEVKKAVSNIMDSQFDSEGSYEHCSYANTRPQLYADMNTVFDWLKQEE